jgi:predicted membrane chloride channel (bestrophin family)
LAAWTSARELWGEIWTTLRSPAEDASEHHSESRFSVVSVLKRSSRLGEFCAFSVAIRHQDWQSKDVENELATELLTRLGSSEHLWIWSRISTIGDPAVD